MHDITSSFTLPEDGWFHIATPGEWPHKPTGLVQIIDDESLDAIVSSFLEEKEKENWPGILIDFDHQSLDQDKPSVAAGWIVELDKRPTGIWARIRWSDVGKKSIEGGRYRFISPVWRSSDCKMLENDRVRPLKLMNCAVTNDPNIKGLFPLSNSLKPVGGKLTPPGVPIIPADPAIFNRMPVSAMDDDQRKAVFAAMAGGGRPGGGRPGGGGGGSGGGGGGGGGNQSPQPPVRRDGSQPDPSDQYGHHPPPVWTPEVAAPGYNPQAARPAPTTAAIQAREQRQRELEAQLEAAQRSLPPRPQPPPDFSRIDVNAVIDEARRNGQNWIQAREAAQAENIRRQQELRAIRRSYERQYSSREQVERAMQRHMDRLDRDYSRDLNRWQTQTDRHQRRINQIQRDIASNEVQLAREMDRYERTLHDNDRRDAHDDARLRRQAIQDEIRHDREAFRRQQIDERARNAEAAIERRERQDAVRAQTMPIQEYNALIRQRRTFHDAISRGHYEEAQRIMPSADIERSIEEFNAIGRATQGMSATQRRERWNQYREQPPPMAGEE